MVRIEAKITPAWQRAITRATEHVKAGRKAERIACKTYRVESGKGDGTAYTVEVQSVQLLHATCDCPHGRSGRSGHCWHAWLAIEAAMARIAACERERAQSAAVPSRADVNAKMARFTRQ